MGPLGIQGQPLVPRESPAGEKRSQAGPQQGPEQNQDNLITASGTLSRFLLSPASFTGLVVL